MLHSRLAARSDTKPLVAAIPTPAAATLFAILLIITYNFTSI